VPVEGLPIYGVGVGETGVGGGVEPAASGEGFSGEFFEFGGVCRFESEGGCVCYIGGRANIERVWGVW
jgi:hypothetical protein